MDEVFKERSLQNVLKTSMESDAKFYILDLSQDEEVKKI
jgi:hypothetical protein